jgi:purine-binding chemotaxis protein CheW
MSASRGDKAAAKFLNTIESGQVLTFVLDNETFGIDILRVREIRGWQSITRIPESAAHVLGVLNIRGAMVAVLDLRTRMAMQPSEYSATTVIIVVSSVTQTGRHDVGFVVDSVSDVVDLRADSVQPMPSVGAAISADYIRGISIDGTGMVMLLDIDQIIGGEQRLMASSTATT